MPDTSPEITPTCTRCGSDAIIPDAFAYVKDVGSVKPPAGVFKKPEAVFMKQPVRTDLRLRVCGDCGLVEVEAEDPHALWEAYVERLSNEFGR